MWLSLQRVSRSARWPGILTRAELNYAGTDPPHGLFVLNKDAQSLCKRHANVQRTYNRTHMLINMCAFRSHLPELVGFLMFTKITVIECDLNHFLAVCHEIR